MMLLEVSVALAYILRIRLKIFNQEYFSKSYTMMLRSFFTFLVFFRHYSEYVIQTSFWTRSYVLFTKVIGQLMVGTFFYLSGFGLTQTYKNKGNDYIKRFNKTHTAKVIFQFWIALLFFIVFNAIVKRTYQLRTVVLSFIAWDNIGNSNWYVFATIYTYLLFWFSHTIFRNDYKKANIVIVIGVILYSIVIFRFKPDYWYSTIFCFPTGVIVSTYKNEIDKVLLSKKNYLLVILLLLFTSVFTIMRYKHVLLYIVSCVLFCFVLTSISTFLTYKNNVIINWIGKNSFGIYLLQRIPMIYFSNYAIVNNDLLKCILCLTATYILLIPYNFIIEALRNR